MLAGTFLGDDVDRYLSHVFWLYSRLLLQLHALQIRDGFFQRGNRLGLKDAACVPLLRPLRQSGHSIVIIVCVNPLRS